MGGARGLRLGRARRRASNPTIAASSARPLRSYRRTRVLPRRACPDTPAAQTWRSSPRHHCRRQNPCSHRGRCPPLCALGVDAARARLVVSPCESSQLDTELVMSRIEPAVVAPSGKPPIEGLARWEVLGSLPPRASTGRTNGGRTGPSRGGPWGQPTGSFKQVVSSGWLATRNVGWLPTLPIGHGRLTV